MLLDKPPIVRKAELDNVLADHGCLATPRPSPSSPEEAQTCLPPICPPGRPVLLLSEERSTRKTPLHQELPHMLGKNKERDVGPPGQETELQHLHFQLQKVAGAGWWWREAPQSIRPKFSPSRETST